MTKKKGTFALVEPGVERIPFPRKMKQGEMRRWATYLSAVTPAHVDLLPNVKTTYSPPIDLGIRAKKVDIESIRYARVQTATTLDPQGTIYTTGPDMLMYKFSTKENGSPIYSGIELRAAGHASIDFNKDQKEMVSRLREVIVDYFRTYRR